MSNEDDPLIKSKVTKWVMVHVAPFPLAGSRTEVMYSLSPKKKNPAFQNPETPTRMQLLFPTVGMYGRQE